MSVFGGIIASNKEIDKETAEEINKIFIEIVVAPSFSKEAFDILSQKKNIRLLTMDGLDTPVDDGIYDMKKVLGGLLVQEYDDMVIDNGKIEYVTKKRPTEKEFEDMIFAMKVVKHTKSNAIVVAKDRTTLGIGGGQVNRIWATKQAIEHSLTSTEGAVLASDAFFPFDDCVNEAHKAGISAIVQPGGSLRDKDSVEACDKYGISMIFTGNRHFKH